MAPISIKPESPLKDDDLSELTKNEIVYWAKKLRMSPSEMFLLSNEELEEQLSMVRKPLKNEESEKPLNDQLENTKQNLRLRGDGKQIWSILIETAGKIQDVLSDESESHIVNKDKKTVLHERMKGGMNPPSTCPQPSSVPLNTTFVSCDCPNNPARLNWPRPYTNSTNYTMCYGPRGTEERADSVSVEPIDANTGIITVSTRIYNTPAPVPCLCPENPLNQQPGAQLGVPQIAVMPPERPPCPEPQTPQRGVQRGRPRPPRALAESVPERIRRRLARRHAKRPITRRRLFPEMQSVSSGTLLEDVSPPSALDEAAYGTILEDVTTPSGFGESTYATAQSALLESATPPSGFEESIYASAEENTTRPSIFNEAAYGSILEDESAPSGFDECPSMSAGTTLLEDVTAPSLFNQATYGSLLEDVSAPSGFDECPSMSAGTTLLEDVTAPSPFNQATYGSLLEDVSAPSGFDECPSMGAGTTLLEDECAANVNDFSTTTYIDAASSPPRPTPHAHYLHSVHEKNYSFLTPPRKINRRGYKGRTLFPRGPGCPPLFSPRDENRQLSPEMYVSPNALPRMARGRPTPRPVAAALRPQGRSPLRAESSTHDTCPEETLLEDETPPAGIQSASFLPSGNSTQMSGIEPPSMFHQTFGSGTRSESSLIEDTCPPSGFDEAINLSRSQIHTTPRRKIDYNTYQPRRLPFSAECLELEQLADTTPGYIVTSPQSAEATLTPSTNITQVSTCPPTQTEVRTTPRRRIDYNTYGSAGSPDIEQIADVTPPYGFDLSALSVTAGPSHVPIRTTPRRKIDMFKYGPRRLGRDYECPETFSPGKVNQTSGEYWPNQWSSPLVESPVEYSDTTMYGASPAFTGSASSSGRQGYIGTPSSPYSISPQSSPGDFSYETSPEDIMYGESPCVPTRRGLEEYFLNL